MDRIIDIIIIFDGERLTFEDVTDVKVDSTNIIFKDKDECQHNFHMVSYHIKRYYPSLQERNLPQNVL